MLLSFVLWQCGLVRAVVTGGLAGSGSAVGSMAPGADKNQTLADKRAAKAEQARTNYLKAHGGALTRYKVSRKGMGGPAWLLTRGGVRGSGMYRHVCIHGVLRFTARVSVHGVHNPILRAWEITEFENDEFSLLKNE